MLYVFDPTPTPPWQEFGGVVQMECAPWHSAAQNIMPSIPGVLPAPAGATVSTYAPVEFSSELLKVVHSGAGFFPVTMYKLQVILAGANGGTGGVMRGYPLTCCCQFDSALDALFGCLFGTIALA